MGWKSDRCRSHADFLIARALSPPRNALSTFVLALPFYLQLKALYSFAVRGWVEAIRPIKTLGYMKRVNAKIEENRKEDPASEPDKDSNTWLIDAKLDEDLNRTTRLPIR